jgi:hypothetical protein
MIYIFTIILIGTGNSTMAGNPSIAMQEFESRKACQNHMLYMKDKLQELKISIAYISCSPKGVP